MADQIRIQVVHKEQVEIRPGQFVDWCDAQYFSESDWLTKDQSKIDAEKEKRIANFVNAIKNPPKPVEPTREDLIKEQIAIDEQVTQLEARKVEVMSKIAVLEITPVEEPVIEEKP